MWIVQERVGIGGGEGPRIEYAGVQGQLQQLQKRKEDCVRLNYGECGVYWCRGNCSSCSGGMIKGMTRREKRLEEKDLGINRT
jgi:hypothetical protein